MTLVHHQAELDGTDTAAIKCHNCGARYPIFEAVDLGDPLRCLQCGTGGMIALQVPRIASERFPDGLAWTPLPEALMDHGATLGLGPNERLTVWALERHRRARGDIVFPSRKRIAELTGLSVGAVKRAIARLVAAELIVRHPRFKDGVGQTSNGYDLDPIWQRLAALDPGAHRASPGSPRPGGTPSGLPGAHPDPGGPAHPDPPPRLSETHEVDVGIEVDATFEGDSTYGASRACGANGHRPLAITAATTPALDAGEDIDF